jgi:PAS domain S-box-containing protein
MSARSPEILQPARNGPADAAVEENRRLRRTMRDLVALSTLPAIWSGLGVDRIAGSLCDVLMSTLSLDAIYVRLARDGQKAPVEVMRCKYRDPSSEQALITSLGSLLQTSAVETAITIPSPFGAGTLRAAVVRFGVAENYGALVACSAAADFPTEQDRLLLAVGANQTAIVTQRRQIEERRHEQREWMRVTLESIGDAVIATDNDGRVTFLNSAAEELTGWTAEEAQGEPLAAVYAVINADTRAPVEDISQVVRRKGGHGSSADRPVLIAKDGTERPIDRSAAPIRDSSNRIVGMVLTFRDVTEQRRREEQRNARLGVTQALIQSTTVQDAATGVLRAVCENVGWDLGFFWLVENERLECRAQWHRPDLALAEFAAESCRHAFLPGVGLPGRVWASGESTWIQVAPQDDNFPRLALATRFGLQSACAFPVTLGDRTLGVIEFFAQRLRVADVDLLEMLGSVAASFGQFIERKSTEDELRQSEEELSEFFENATVGLHWVGPDGRILRVNRAELDMLGYTREEYLGHSITDFHVDQDVICDILAKLRSGERLAEYPARLRCKDGSIKDVLIDSSVSWRGNEFVHTRCFTRDITERKRAEIALADARSRLDAALAAGAIATWTWDIINNRLHADPKLAELFSLPPSEAAGGLLDQYLQAIHPEDRQTVIGALDRAIKTGETYTADYRIVQRDGSIRWVTARGLAEVDGNGRPVRMPGVLVDITDRKRLEEELRIRIGQLRDNDRRKDEFLATLAHELRNPLAPIRNSLQILKMPRIDAAMVEQTRAMMERQVHHLVRLVDDLLDVSRVMRGKIELRKEPVELATVVVRAVETVQPLIEVQGHRLDLSLPKEPLLVEGDTVRLAQVVGNLLTNAAKYTDANGNIWVSAARDQDKAVLRVRDNGIGIAPDTLPHVFELFVQADHTTSKSQGGLGIGLTLAKNLSEMHGGTIEAHSAGLGMGCEFTVRLPLLAANAGLTTKPDQDLMPKTVATGHRLLVVDDNKDAASSLAILLRMRGHEVRVVHDGPAALEVAVSYLPNMIFLDIGMPGMDGYEVARRIRQRPGLESVMLAALTGWGQLADRERSRDAGIDHHLVKPVDSEALEAVLWGLTTRLSGPSSIDRALTN